MKIGRIVDFEDIGAVFLFVSVQLILNEKNKANFEFSSRKTTWRLFWIALEKEIFRKTIIQL